MTHRQPTDGEVRQCIDAIENPKYRDAFRYQLLVAGRLSEVCGKYAPRGFDAFEVEFDGVSAVLFAVKTAKRRGKLRACALPLDPKYEPWAQPLLEVFKDADENYPFVFAENLNTSKRYMQWAAEKAFDGLEWPLIEYTKSVEIEVTKDQIIREAINMKNKEVYLVELENGERGWFTKVKDGVVLTSEKVYGRWKPFRSHALRKRRTVTLSWDYLFDPFDLAAYGGWTEKSQVDALPAALKHYLYVDIQEAREALALLKQMARRYFSKLLRPYNTTFK